MNYCVPAAVVQVTLIIRRDDGQWAKYDKLIVSVVDYFNEAIYLPNDASNNSHHSANNGNESRE